MPPETLWCQVLWQSNVSKRKWSTCAFSVIEMDTLKRLIHLAERQNSPVWRMGTTNNVRPDKVRNLVQDDERMPFLLQCYQVKVKHATEQVRSSGMSSIVEIPILSIAMSKKQPSCTRREFVRGDFITIYGREGKPWMTTASYKNTPYPRRILLEAVAPECDRCKRSNLSVCSHSKVCC